MMELRIIYYNKDGISKPETFSVTENCLLSLYEELDTMYPLGWEEK